MNSKGLDTLLRYKEEWWIHRGGVYYVGEGKVPI